jgi:hypothetical protein
MDGLVEYYKHGGIVIRPIGILLAIGCWWLLWRYLKRKH